MVGPQLAPDGAEASPDRLRFFVGRIAQGLPAAEAQEFRAAVHRATENGSMLWAEPYHCAIATRS